ncbi:hypothetical protein PBRA_006422 [Plasmodiophora brassicae]|nr:hypothetical protein PBRA_006422 [Plasmodiophora brassicae]
MHPQSLDSDANRPPLQSYAPVHMARLGPADFQPRQFEYCPAAGADMLAIGSCNGDLVVVDWNDNRVINRGAMSGDMLDDKAILSLSWLHGSSHSNMFFAGNSMGSTALYKVVAGAERLALCHDYGTICKSHDMTSIHVNVSDELLLSSGHSHHVRVVDVKTGHVVRKYKSIHEDAINVSRWGNVFANVFLTCSFDRNVKLWDVRCPGRDPIYKLSSKNGNVMCCFSPDDRHFLCSSVNNEVKQYETVDGRLNVEFRLPRHGAKSKARQSYTRSYYAGIDQIVTGSSSEGVVRSACTMTGEVIGELSLVNGATHPSIHIQSLRPNPRDTSRLAVLIFHRHVSGYDIVDVRTDKDAWVSVRRLSSDLNTARLSRFTPGDIELVANDGGEPVPGHIVILRNRWPWFQRQHAQRHDALPVPCTSPVLDLVLEYLYADIVNVVDLDADALIDLYRQIAPLDLNRMSCIVLANLATRMTLGNVRSIVTFADEVGRADLLLDCIVFMRRHWLWFRSGPSTPITDRIRQEVGKHVVPAGEVVGEISTRIGHRSVVVGSLMFLIGGLAPTGARDLDYVPVLDLASNEWWLMPTSGDAPVSLAFHTATLIGDSTVYCIGGSPFFGSTRDEHRLAPCYTLCLKTLRWDKVVAAGEHVPSRRSRHACVAVGNDLWLFGGKLAHGAPLDGLYRLEHLSARAPTWSTVWHHKQPTGRSGHTMTYCPRQRAIVVLGGHISNDLIPFDVVATFDVVGQEWHSKAVQAGGAGYPIPRLGHTATLSEDGDAIIVIGGRTSRSQVETDDDIVLSDTWALCLRTWQWTRVPTTGQVPHYDHSAWSTGDGRVAVCGWSRGSRSGGALRCLTLATGAWANLECRLNSTGACRSAISVPASTLTDDLTRAVDECNGEPGTDRDDCVRLVLGDLGSSVQVPRFLCDARSVFLRRMFAAGMAETRTRSARLPGVSTVDATRLLWYMQTGQVVCRGEPGSDSDERLIRMLVASRFLAVDSLSEHLERLMIGRIRRRNMDVLRRVADQHYLEHLRRACLWRLALVERATRHLQAKNTLLYHVSS